jgi:hypothetical protein
MSGFSESGTIKAKIAKIHFGVAGWDATADKPVNNEEEGKSGSTQPSIVVFLHDDENTLDQSSEEP